MQSANTEESIFRIFISFSGCPQERLLDKAKKLDKTIVDKIKVNEQQKLYNKVTLYATPIAQLLFDLLADQKKVLADQKKVLADQKKVLAERKKDIEIDSREKFDEIKKSCKKFEDSKFYNAGLERLPFNRESLAKLLDFEKITPETITQLRQKSEKAIESESIELIWQLVADVINFQFGITIDLNVVMNTEEYQEKYFIYCILAEIEFMLVKIQEQKRHNPNTENETVNNLIDIMAMTKHVYGLDDERFRHAKAQIDKIKKPQFRNQNDKFFSGDFLEEQKKEEYKNLKKADLLKKIFQNKAIILKALPLMLESLVLANQANNKDIILYAYYMGTHGFNPVSKSHEFVKFLNLDLKELNGLYALLNGGPRVENSAKYTGRRSFLNAGNRTVVANRAKYNSDWKLFTALFLLSTFGFFAYMKSYSIKLQDLFKGKALKVSFNILFIMALGFFLSAAVYNLPSSAIAATKVRGFFAFCRRGTLSTRPQRRPNA